jgi:rod shape determining protein RodA
MRGFGYYWRLVKRMNLPMTVAICVLMVIGVAFVYGACYSNEELQARPLFAKQILWAFVGLFCYLAMAAWDYQRLSKLAWPAYGACLFLLVLVLIVGKKMYGATRWLELVGGINIQPSELAKLATVFVLASMLNRSGMDFGRIGPLAGLLAVVVVPVLLIMKEPDLGTAMVFVPTLFVMMFVAGVPFRMLLIMIGIGMVGVGIVLGALFLPGKFGADEAKQEKIMKRVGISEYQKNRISVFLNAEKDPLGAGWNKLQSEIAVGSGGTWGKGFMKGTQNILGFLPRSVAPTDFIYSVIAEETGFFGSVVVLFLFGSITFFGLQTALAARDKLGRLLCVGMIGVIFSHVFINIAMTIGLMPITGLPLPLLSYGGTFMIVVLVALGVVQSVYIRSRHVA